MLQVLKYLAWSGNADARLIRDRLTVIVIPMYNPDGATANIRQSTTPLRIDLNRDWELFQQPESRAFYELWETTRPRLALDLHHMGQSPIVAGTNELNTFQIGARSIDPSRMTALQWLTNRQMAMISTAAVSRLGPGNVRALSADRHHERRDQPHAAGRPRPGRERPGLRDPGRDLLRGALRGPEEQRHARAAVRAADDGRARGGRRREPVRHPGTGWEDIPFGDGEPCGGGPG